MARLIYGTGMASNASGRMASGVGGIVYQKNGRVRTYITPSNPQTTAQLTIRGNFAAALSGWATISDDLRAGYESAAASGAWAIPDPLTGVPRNPTGRELWIELYMNLTTVSVNAQNVLDNGVPTKVLANTAILDVLTMDASAGTATLSYTGAYDSGAGVAVIFATQPLPATTMKPRKSAMRLIGIYSAASPLDIAADYIAVHGAITSSTGQKVFVQGFVIDAGTGEKLSLGAAQTVIVA